MTLEEIIELNKELSYHKLIYKYYKRKDYIIWRVLPLILVAVTLFIYISSVMVGKKFDLLFILIFPLIYMFVGTDKCMKLTKKVLQDEYSIKNKSRNSISINLLRAKIVKKKLKLTNKEDVINLISFLEREHNYKIYRFELTKNFSLLLFSACLGGVLGSYFGLFEKEEELVSNLNSIIILTTITIALVLIVEFLIKQIFIDYKGSKHRLIRALENMYLDLKN